MGTTRRASAAALLGALAAAACSPADHAYYARGKVRQAVSDGFAAAGAYDRYLQERKAPPRTPQDIGLAPSPGSTRAVSVQRDRIVLELDASNLPTGRFVLAGKHLTFSAAQVAGGRAWTCASSDLEEVLLPENCRAP